MGIEPILGIFFSFVIGVVFGAMATFLFRRMMVNRQLRIAQRKTAKIMAEAEVESKNVVDGAKQEAEKIKAAADAENRERRAEFQRQENRLAQKTETVERKLEGLEQRERNLSGKEKESESIRSHLEELKNRQIKQLELISGMSTNEAKQNLLDATETEMRDEFSRRLREWEAKLKEEADKKAQEILVAGNTAFCL